MAASSDVAAFRAAGHSVSLTASHFGISERAVYKACQAQAARLRRGVSRVASARPVVGGSTVYTDLADDVAGDHTYWRCPVTHELLAVERGSTRLEWMRQRREGSSLAVPVEDESSILSVAPELVFEPTPEPTPEPVFVALESEIEPTEPTAVSLALPLPIEHNQRLSVVDWSHVQVSLLAWFAEYWRVPFALAVAVLLIWACR